MRWLRRTLAGLGFVGLAYLYLAFVHPPSPVAEHPFFDALDKVVVAHRGGSGLWPENTMLALRGSIELGADILEMDLRASADGEIVLMHDETVDRTTDGTGRVEEMSFADLRELDVAYRFQDVDGAYPYRGAGVQVPKLEEVLERFRGRRMIMEVKRLAPEQILGLCDLIQGNEMDERVLVATFDHEVMLSFREHCPRVATSASFREALLFYQLNRLHLGSLYRSPAVALQVPEHFGEMHVVRPEFLEIAREHNIRVHVWTVNEGADMKRLLQMGVDGILTDYPDRLLVELGRAAQARSSLD